MPAVAGRGRGRRTINEINMVPFIDVMLVLLIIFMVTAPLITPSMIDLPSVGRANRLPDQKIEIVQLRLEAKRAAADAHGLNQNIQRLTTGGAWVTLAAYEDENDIEGLMLLRYWFITGTLILTKADWLTVMEHAGYTGDYRFDTAKSLNLVRG